MNSSFFSINWRDVSKSALLLLITSVLTTVLTSLQTDPPHVPTLQDLKTALFYGGAAAVSYIIRKLLENSNGDVLKKEPTK